MGLFYLEILQKTTIGKEILGNIIKMKRNMEDMFEKYNNYKSFRQKSQQGLTMNLINSRFVYRFFKNIFFINTRRKK